MAELSLESVRDYMIMNGGKVTNHDLVTHFKYFLTNPQNRGKYACIRRTTSYSIPVIKWRKYLIIVVICYCLDAKHQFKEIVNTVATVIRGEDVMFNCLVILKLYSSTLM